MSKKSPKRISVLIVDDSLVSRTMIRRMLAVEPRFVLHGEAEDPYAAQQIILESRPDVIVLDLEMPRMDGISFLKILMEHSPIPVVIFSSITTPNSETVLQALAAGAVDVVCKAVHPNEFGFVGERLRGALMAASQARLNRLAPPVSPPIVEGAPGSNQRVIAVGCSTGGTQALERILTELPTNLPGMLIVQHMPDSLTPAFARRLDTLSQLEVREARDGDPLAQGTALVAPGGWHMRLHRHESRYFVRLSDDEPVRFHRPSADVLFDSVAAAAGENGVGALLTGMGADGAKGLLAMRRAGAETLAEDESTCVVYGMPKAAARLGAAGKIVRLDLIATEILRCCLKGETRHAPA